MSRDVTDVIGEAIGNAAHEVVESIAHNARKASRSSNGHVSAGKGAAAGAGLVALAPLLVKGAGKLADRSGGNGSGKSDGNGSGAGPIARARKSVSHAVSDKVGKKMSDSVGEKLDDKGGLAKQAGKMAGLSKSSGGTEGVPKGRRMPIQQSVDVAVPLSEAYNAWTQFEEWPQFMHRLDRVTQEDDTHVSFKTKMWGFSREFEAEIVEQRPDDRVRWRVVDGVSHSGVVSFHPISDRLTRVEVDISVHPGSLIEKAARGMRHVKRAVRADLARFKAHVELDEDEHGEWRGTIEDGDVKRNRGSARAAGAQSRSRTTGARSRSASTSGGSKRSQSRRAQASSGGGRTKAASSGSGRTKPSGGSSRAKASSSGSRSKPATRRKKAA
jgi:uncharacterized membrane protein